jgi:hypothetical protein
MDVVVIEIPNLKSCSAKDSATAAFSPSEASAETYFYDALK